MAWFKKKPDPISDRERALNQEIAELDAQIKRLDAQMRRNEAQPRLRSTALPQGAMVSHSTSTGAIATSPMPPPAPEAHDPIFEEVGYNVLKSRGETATSQEHYNELGVRKYDLPALVRRLRTHLRGPSTTNPKLVSYLAAGGLQGLRPLRYEKRVARNRFIAFVAFLFLMLLGTIMVFVRAHR